MLLMVDNYDSFTYNLVQYFLELGQMVETFRNDAITVADIEVLKPDYIVISPGPCTPNEAGISLAVVEKLQGKFPILGVCLGHQSICQAFGGRIVKAKKLMHGKTSNILHDGRTIFSNIPSPFTATRYHSLVAERESLPDDLEISAYDDELHEIMGVRHKTLPIEGVQFHPESILTNHGKGILSNFLTIYGAKV
ncbi:MAG: aminodeoxychorismate/anthranilate synthase component II [Nitrospinae bacterium]|nr:aminodeoxychorismate/anthranilate synthase component II [Nitrospinota bacterium]